MGLLEEILQVNCDKGDEPSYKFVKSDGSTTLYKNDIDSVLLYQLTENEDIANHFEYLNKCFQHCQNQRRLNRTNPSIGELNLIFDELDRLVVGYGLVALQVVGFCINDTYSDYFKGILNNVDNYLDFLNNIIQRACGENSILDFLDVFFPSLHEYLTTDLDHFDLNDFKTYTATLTLFEQFLNFKNVAAIFTKISHFFAEFDCKPDNYEKVTILGPILSLSPLDPNASLRNYGDNLERSQDQMNMIHESLQTEQKVVLDRLFYIIDKIIRGSVESRTDLISYFAQVVNKNHLRRGDHANPNKLASNSFMTNIALILIKFSQPFLDISYKKIDKIDVNYFNTLNLFLDLTGETRTNSDFKEADRFYDENKKDETSKPNFISDCFFLSLTYLHYGLGGTVLYDEKISSQIKKLEQEIGRINKMSQQQPVLAPFISLRMKQMEKSLLTLKSSKNSLQGFFSHRNLQLEVFDFICGASTFFIRVIDPSHQYPFQPLSLPLIPDQVGVENVDNADYLRAHAPVPFKYYPEYVIEGLINYSVFISQYSSSPIFKNPRLKSFLEFATIILRCPELVSNPHLKGKLVQFLSVGAMPLTDDSPGFMMETFEHNDMICKNLLYALLDFYVIVEKTGSSSQFYDKFNSRYSISIILEQLYHRIPLYKNQLIVQSRKNADFFVRFVARMLNDLTFLLDEGLSNLAEVHNIQIELDNRVKGIPPTREEDDNELQSKLMSAERQAKSSCGLSAKSMALFEIYSKDIPNAFVTPEIVDRLASMLNHNLESLVGPKCGELKVKDPLKYSFDPKKLLKALATVYIHLSGEHEFVSAVARDGRSFSKDLFERAVYILGTKTGLITEEFCEQLLKFANDAESQKIADEEEDMELGDVPDEFLDPLMYTLMKDPVTLPTSKVVIDRSTIKAHLLSDSTDPFNRMPLKLEEVIPNEEMKQKITDFKLQRKLEKSSNK